MALTKEELHPLSEAFQVTIEIDFHTSARVCMPLTGWG